MTDKGSAGTGFILSPQGLQGLSASRLLGKVSAFLFLLAIFAVGDAVQTMVRTPFNQIELSPGETARLTGPLPLETTVVSDLKPIFLAGAPFSVDGYLLSSLTKGENNPSGAAGLAALPRAAELVFTPSESFRGFWLGGNMWRAVISATDSAMPGQYTLVIEETIPLREKDFTQQLVELGITERQNPGLIFPAIVYASREERQSASFSLVERMLGWQAYSVAVTAVVLAIVGGLFGFLAYRNGERALIKDHVAVVFGMKKQEDGSLAALFTLPPSVLATDFLPPAPKRPGQRVDVPAEYAPVVALLTPDGSFVCTGTITAMEHRGRTEAVFPSVRPQYGWLVAYGQEDHHG